MQLREIGFSVVIGHEVGSCPRPAATINNFTVVDTSGIHIFPVSFCQCIGHVHPRIQLLRAGWFPASLERPRSAFTFDCLETFQYLNLQGKLSAHGYCKTLDQISDATSLSNFPVLIFYSSTFMNINLMYHQYRTVTIHFYRVRESGVI